MFIEFNRQKIIGEFISSQLTYKSNMTNDPQISGLRQQSLILTNLYVAGRSADLV